MIRGHLEIIVLKLISKEPLSGYVLMKKIKELIGEKPSSGSMYPLLEKLSKKSLIKVENCGRRKIYHITKQGKIKLKMIYDKHDEIIGKINEGFILLDKVFGKKMIKEHKIISEEIKKGKFPFECLDPEVSNLREALVYISSQKNDKKTIKIKKILKQATKQIRLLE